MNGYGYGNGQLGVGTRASFAEAVKAEESGSISGGSLRDQAEASFSLSKDPSGPDFFLLDLAEKLENCVSPEQQGDTLGSRALAELRDRSAEKALNSRWPTNKDEAYRFTDVRFLKNLDISPTPSHYANTLDFASGNCFVAAWTALPGCLTLVRYLVKFSRPPVIAPLNQVATFGFCGL